MICRLCLCDLENSVCVYIFSGADNGLSKVIAKYLQLEVNINDIISNRLCTECWRNLTEFEHFCAMVAEKQQMLLKTEPEPPPEPAVVVWNTESPIESKLVFDEHSNDIKDHILCEPEIDVHDDSRTMDNHFNDHSSDSSKSCDAFADEFEHVPAITAKPKQTKGKTRQLQANKRDKTKQTASSLAAAATTSLSSTSLRESRARSRELRRNAAIEAPPESPVTTKPITKSIKSEKPSKPTISLTTGKRGRPKGKKNKSSVSTPKVPRPKMDGSELAAKRSSIKEMDDYIAANVKLDCCLCAAPLEDFVELKRHFRVTHNCTGYMQCCNNRYKKRTLYVDHLHYHKDPQYFSCKPCRKSFLNRNSQDMHMLRFHSDQQQLVHQCAICEARFAKKFLLTMHIKGHKGTERTEACETCSKTFRSKAELTAHVKRMHDSDFAPVICDICGSHFRSKANFLTHKKALHPEGPVEEVQCHLCSRWLRDERSLRKHLARHDDREGNNKYRCVLCSAEKSSRVALSSHMRYHHSSKRHSCTLCGKEFKLSRALAEHMATHTGIDLYSCQFCARTFKSHANMHNHKKKMHPNEWVRKYTQPTAVAPNGAAGGGTEAAAAATTVAGVTTTPPTTTVASVVIEGSENVDVALDSPLEFIEEGTQHTISDASGTYQYISNGSVCPI